MPVRLILTAGQRGDITEAHALIEGLAARYVLADTAYDGDNFRNEVNTKNAQAVIPSNPSRAKKLPLDKDIYKAQHLVECAIN